jgi:hypothetical protein
MKLVNMGKYRGDETRRKIVVVKHERKIALREDKRTYVRIILECFIRKRLL